MADLDVTIDTATGTLHGTITGLPDQEIDVRAIRARLEALSGHTPGPWTHHRCLCGHRACNQYTISTQGGVGFQAEDARLIAAAPDLLAITHRLLDMIGEGTEEAWYAGFETGFREGFAASSEGWNGEYGCFAPEQDEHWLAKCKEASHRCWLARCAARKGGA